MSLDIYSGISLEVQLPGHHCGVSVGQVVPIVDVAIAEATGRWTSTANHGRVGKVGSIIAARSCGDMSSATQEASRGLMHMADKLEVGFIDELVESRIESSLEMKRIAELLSAVRKLKSYVSKRLHLSSYEIPERLELVICSVIALQ